MEGTASIELSMGMHDVTSATRRGKFKRHSSTTFFRVSCLALLLARYQSTAANNQYGECYQDLYAADQAGNQDLFLSQTEFQDAVRRLTFGAVSALSTPLDMTFDLYQNGNGAIWVSGVEPNAVSSDPEKTAFLNEFCDDVYKAILTTLGLAPDYESCKLWMSIADRVTGAKDDRLEKLREYPVFANRMTGNDLYSADVTFTALPPPVQMVFGEFENPNDPGMINVTGSWLLPGQATDPAQQATLENLCRQMMVAIEAGKVYVALPTTAPFPAPTPAPTLAPSTMGDPVTFSLGSCMAAMVQADAVIDNVLTQPEYVDFLNRLTNDRYPNASFKNLPLAMQDMYAQKATADGTNGVSIEGARYGSTRTTATLGALAAFCNATKLALNGQSTSFTSNPTMAPAPAPPHGIFYIPFADCTLAMATSQIGNPDNTLNQQEYVLFLNKATSFQFFRDDQFIDLPMPLVNNYNNFADGQGIPVDGSFPGQSRTPDQNNNLLTICLATSAAIGQAVYNVPVTTAAPTPGPAMPSISPASTVTTPPPVPPTWQPTNAGTVPVYNAFVVSNNAGLGIADLTNGNLTTGNLTSGSNTSTQLLQGYSNFVSEIVDNVVNGTFLQGGETRLRRRLTRSRRKLPWTGLVADSASLYEIDEYPCPLTVANTTGVVCHVVYGSFEASFVNEANTAALAASLSQLIQNTVMSANGGLGSFVNRTSTGLVVEGVPGNGRVRPADMTPTSAPASSFDTKSTGNGNDDNGMSTGLLVGIIVGLAVLFCCCCVGIFVWHSTSPRSKRAQDPSQMLMREDSVSEDSEGFKKQEAPLPSTKLRGPSMKPQRSTKLRGPSMKPRSTIDRKTEESENSNDRDEFSLEEENQPLTRSSGVRSSGMEKSSSVFGSFFVRGGSTKEQQGNGSTEDPRGMFASQQLKSQSMAPSSSSDWDPVLPQSSRVNWATAVFGSKKNNDSNDSQKNLGQNGNDRVDEKSEEFKDEIISDEEEGDEVEEGDDDDYADEFRDEGEESESETYKGDGNSYVSNSRNSYVSNSRNSRQDEKSVGTVRQFDSMIDKGDWDGIIDNAKRLERKNDDADSYIQPRGVGRGTTKSPSEAEEESESEEEEEETEKEDETEEEEEASEYDEEEANLFTTTESRSSNEKSSRSLMSEELRTREAYRVKIEYLVSKVVPNEKNNVDSMMVQFKGREEELIQTLENMYLRSSGVRGENGSSMASTTTDMADDIEHSHSEFSYSHDAENTTSTEHENSLLGQEDDDDEESESGFEDKDEEESEEEASEEEEESEDEESEDVESQKTSETDYGYEPAEPTRANYASDNPEPSASSYEEEHEEEEVSYADKDHEEESYEEEQEEEEESEVEEESVLEESSYVEGFAAMNPKYSTKKARNDDDDDDDDSDEDEVVPFDVEEHNEIERRMSVDRDDAERHIGNESGSTEYEEEEKEVLVEDDDDNDGGWRSLIPALEQLE